MYDLKVKTLLVDDDEQEFLLLRYTFAEIRDLSVELAWVADYDEALALIRQNEFDAYLLDYNLGHRSGIDLLREAQALGVRAPFIMLTGQGSMQVDLEALQAGAIDYLDKNDLKPSTLSRSLRYAIANKRAENEVHDLYARVSRLEQLKSDMIRIASHDLRNPLMVILGNLRQLQESHTLSPQDHTTVIQIDQAVMRMRTLIGDLLSLERIEMYAQESGFQPVDLCVLAQTALETFVAQAQEKQLELGYDPAAASLIVRGDSVQLMEALTNLIGNAIKYTPNNGAVGVRLYAEGDRAFVRVEDTGYGVPLNQQGQLFRPFSRIKTKETQTIDGTGLGLHLVKNIVERHQGEIIFSSVYGEGSVFGFALPLEPAAD